MVDLHSSSDEESLDSDEELQVAFAEGKLKDGLNYAVPAPKVAVNNVAGIQQKLQELQQNVDWIERLDLTNAPVAAGPGETEDTDTDDLANSDFKRELRFYRQAQASVLDGIPRLGQLGVKTKRPEDYFAEMAKSDMHMKKVREKLLEKQQSLELRDKARKMRELRKYGKKVQQDVLLKRQKEKKEMLDAVKKYRKGQKNKLDFLEEMKSKSGTQKGQKAQPDKPHQPNKKRQFKNDKYGFGGQKKRSKMNTSESTMDMSGFSVKHNNTRPGKKYVNKNKKGARNKRPGKAQRHKISNKKK